MARRMRVGEMLLAVEGLALARHVFSENHDLVQARIDGLRATIGTLDRSLDRSLDRTGDAAGGNEAPDQNGAIEALSVAFQEVDAATGYDRWAASYDTAENTLITVEEPILRAVLEPIPVGDALDACCGTGRVTRLLADLGQRVTGVDQSERMLVRARQRVPSAEFRCAELCAHSVDMPTGSYDLIVCALALTHFERVVEPIAALAHLLRDNGRLVLTDAHPTSVLLGGQAIFNDETDGATRFVRNHVHPISTYLDAFAANGLRVNRCFERTLRAGEGPMATLAGHLRPAAAADAFVGIPYVLAWDLTRVR